MYPWGVCEHIRTNTLNKWPSASREALRTAYALEPAALRDVDAFDRLGSMLTIMRLPLHQLNNVLPVVVLGELEGVVVHDGLEPTLEVFRAQVRDMAASDLVSEEVLVRVLEIEQTRMVLAGEPGALVDVCTNDIEAIADLIASTMVSSLAELDVIVGSSSWKPVAQRGGDTCPEARMLALLALKEQARALGSLG